MSSLKQIRTRIGSVKNTAQITQAMKMVATAKLRKAQDRILNLRAYAENIFTIIADTAAVCEIDHPLIQQKEKLNRVLLVVLTSDRGLCAGFNNNICRYAEDFYFSHKDKQELDFFFIGKKAKNYFQFRGIESKSSIFHLDKEISYSLAVKVAKQLMDHFSGGLYDGVYFIYNHFQSAVLQKVTKEVFLPLDLSHSSMSHSSSFSKDLLFETSPKELLEELIAKHFAIQVYRCMCESVASEYGARMNAMENASKNAKEIISKLTLTFNKLRQSAITTELIEVCSGAEALKA